MFIRIFSFNGDTYGLKNSHDHQSLLVVLLINIGKASRSCILISVVTRTSTNCPDIKPYHQEYLSSKIS